MDGWVIDIRTFIRNAAAVPATAAAAATTTAAAAAAAATATTATAAAAAVTAAAAAYTKIGNSRIIIWPRFFWRTLVSGKNRDAIQASYHNLVHQLQK